MEAQHIGNSMSSKIVVAHLDLDVDHLFAHSGTSWDEYVWPHNSNGDAESYSIQPYTGCMTDQNVLWGGQYHNAAYQYEGLEQCRPQATSNLLPGTPLSTTLSPLGSLSSSSPSTLSFSPRSLNCGTEFEGRITTSPNMQEYFPPYPTSPENCSFSWDAQSPTFGFGPIFSLESTDRLSPPPTFMASTPLAAPQTSESTRISLGQGSTDRLSSLSPLEFLAPLPSNVDSDLSTSQPEQTKQRLLTRSQSPLPLSKMYCPSSPPLLFHSLTLRKSARLASKVTEGPTTSQSTTYRSVSTPTRDSTPKRRFEEAFIPDDSCDSSSYELDDDNTGSESEDTNEPVTCGTPPCTKRPRKHHQKKLKLRKKCSKCSETFTRSADRARHLAAIHSINAKSRDEGRCRGCSKYLSRRDSRQRHERKCVDFFRLTKPNESESI